MLASNDVKLKGEDRRGIVFSLACNRILYI